MTEKKWGNPRNWCLPNVEKGFDFIDNESLPAKVKAPGLYIL